MLGYVLAVMQRTTFGVSGLDAADRFGISPAALSAFVFLQVAVYIAAQFRAACWWTAGARAPCWC